MSTTAEQTTSIPAGTWSVDPIHSSVGFAVTYSGSGTFRGGFKEFDAKLVDGELEGVAKVASVDIDEPNLAGHLQTPDFFDAEQHPELRFTSKEIRRDGDVCIRGRHTAVHVDADGRPAPLSPQMRRALGGRQRPPGV